VVEGVREGCHGQQLDSPSEAREVPWELRVQVIVASLARETPVCFEEQPTF